MTAYIDIHLKVCVILVLHDDDVLTIKKISEFKSLFQMKRLNN